MTPMMKGLFIAFIAAALITAALTFVAVREIVASRSEASLSESLLVGSIPQPLLQVAPLPDEPLQSARGPTPQPWDGANRVTVLLMGLDFRDWEGDGPSRTDTMILLSVDPVTRSAGMLSIPRDLWVYIPGFEYGKINTAYFLGEIYQLPGGGPGLAIQTVQQFLGLPVNYYAQVDFSAFERFIDEIGGIEVDVPEEISVDPIGPGNTVLLFPGLQVLNGPVALAYARNRDTLGGDFDRAQRQQQVILAIRDRILNLDMLPSLISKAPLLYRELASGVHTNMTLEEIIKLAWLAQQIPPENIQRAWIGTDQVTMTYSPEGLDILLPDTDQVRILRDQVFTASGPISPVATSGDPKALMEAEAAAVSVLNATYTIGLASETTQYLNSQGVNVTITGNAQEAVANTTIIDYTGNPYTVQYLVQLMEIQPNRIFSRYDPNSEVDLAILLGDDWAADNPMP